jgi:threonyl-tRNA synthetase
VQVDQRVETIGYKIREAQLQKIPYMLVVGDREGAEGTVAVRSRSSGDLGSRSLDAFITSAGEEVETKGSQLSAISSQRLERGNTDS